VVYRDFLEQRAHGLLMAAKSAADITSRQQQIALFNACVLHLEGPDGLYWQCQASWALALFMTGVSDVTKVEFVFSVPNSENTAETAPPAAAAAAPVTAAAAPEQDSERSCCFRSEF
jgi:hypothetical protein